MGLAAVAAVVGVALWPRPAAAEPPDTFAVRCEQIGIGRTRDGLETYEWFCRADPYAGRAIADEGEIGLCDSTLVSDSPLTVRLECDRHEAGTRRFTNALIRSDRYVICEVTSSPGNWMTFACTPLAPYRDVWLGR